MGINFSNKWRHYKKAIKELETLQVQSSLFPGRKNLSDRYEELRKELFRNYEGMINSNNTINPVILKRTIIDWVDDNYEDDLADDVYDYVDELEFREPPVIRYIADVLIGEELYEKFFLGEEEDMEELVHQVIRNADRYTHVPDTEDNMNTFLNGSTQYLVKESNAQEDNSSPIEVIMYDALKPIASKHGYKIKREHPVYDDGRLEIRYSLDIVFLNDKNHIVLDVETDGLTYHKGYEQMTSDRARDRWLLIRGTPTMRFTSREVFNDLDSCVEQVDYALQSLKKAR